MVDFTYENGWVYGKTNEDTTDIGECAFYFDPNTIVCDEGKIAVKFDLKYLPNVIKMVERRQINYIKRFAIEEWEKVSKIAIPGTPCSVLLQILSQWDKDKCEFNVNDNYLEVSLPFGTYTIILEDNKVRGISEYINLFDGKKTISDSAYTYIYLTKEGTLDIRID